MVASAQQTMPVVGFYRSPGESADVVAAFRKACVKIGFVEGQNVVIAFRWWKVVMSDYQRLHLISSICVSPCSSRLEVPPSPCPENCMPQ
jgi:hypothetical protein